MSEHVCISVIVPYYNAQSHIQKCIDLLLNQDFKNTFEIIMVDDGSTDNSKKIVLQNEDKKIRSYSLEKNSGPSAARNFGIKKSKGKYIFFLDSDDFFKKKKLELIVKEFKKKRCDLIFDLPIFKYKNKQIKKKFKQKKFIVSSWPRFSPQSCISIEKKFAQKIFKILKIKKFETIWLDFRIAVYHFLKRKNIYIFKKHLTYYRQLENSASKKYKIFNKNWWYRRSQAHEFVTFINKKLKLKDPINIDKILTKTINIF